MRSCCRIRDGRRRGTLCSVAAALIVLLPAVLSVGQAIGQIDANADNPAALVVFPLVRFGSAEGIDTRLRLSNAGATDTTALCIYETAERRCADSLAPCETNADCEGDCETVLETVDFRISLAAGQPIEWLAGEGLALLAVPAVSEDPFVGAMRCFVIDQDTGRPVAGPPSGDVMEGVATIERANSVAVEISRYRAIGFASLGNDGDDTLEIGGPAAEYAGCANALILNHLFEHALEPIRQDATIRNELALLSCSADYDSQSGARDVVHLFVYNEFEQRLGASARIDAQLISSLSEIHATVFDVTVQGTLGGQTRIQSVTGGLVGLAIRRLERANLTLAAPVVELHSAGLRSDADRLQLFSSP